MFKYGYYLLSDDEKENAGVEAIAWFKKCIENNYSVSFAYSNLGYTYQYGKKGVQKNLYFAVKYYELGVAAESDYSAMRLAEIYENGDTDVTTEIKKDKEKAIEYYTLASNLGNMEAQTRLEGLQKTEHTILFYIIVGVISFLLSILIALAVFLFFYDVLNVYENFVLIGVTIITFVASAILIFNSFIIIFS